MAIRLIKLTKKYRRQAVEMLDEWIVDQEKNHTDTSPWAIFRNDHDDFDYYLNNLDTDTPKDGFVANSVFFLYDDSKDRLLGAVDIRHTLNDHLRKYGGHIGDGIRPSERGKGYGKLLIALALEECLKLGINDVLICCNETNVASRKCILANGGVFEDTIVDLEGETMERYWINAPKEVLKNHIPLIHNTELGEERINKNTGLYPDEILSEIKDALIVNTNLSEVKRIGKNYYLKYRDVEFTINASSYTVITAKVVK